MKDGAVKTGDEFPPCIAPRAFRGVLFWHGMDTAEAF